MRVRQMNLKLLAVCVTATVLLCAWYMLTGPIIAAAHDEWYPVASKHPTAMVCLELFFAPINLYYGDRELPGSAAYRDYVDWCYDAAGDP